MFESLESRRMLSGVSVSVSGGTMTITGSSKADVISIREDGFGHAPGEVTVYDGTTGVTYLATGITAINANMNGGNDRVDFTGSTVGANIHGNGGDDSLSVDDEGSGSSTVSGDAGKDSISVLHGNNTQVFGGDGDDKIYLNTDGDGGTTNTDAGGGNDVITTYGGANTINGGAGTDTLINFGGVNTTSNVEKFQP